jgi:L-2,4-diaminobutyrate decarboxylase
MSDRLEALLRELERDRTLESGIEVARVAAEYFAASRAGERAVTTRLGAHELVENVMRPGESGRPLAEVTAALRWLVAQSNWLNHPRYMGHQVSAALPLPVWSEAVIAALNQSVAIHEMSPAANAVEHVLIEWLLGHAGFGAGAGGTFTSGGTEANFTALLAARAAALPDAWREGVDAARAPVLVCGAHAHYAITRSAAQLGLGMRRVVAIPVTREFRMDVAALDHTLSTLEAEGTGVLAVVATAGSTPTGSYDDLEGIAELCAPRDLWLHVDGAHGLSALLSSRRRALVAGVGRARTAAWDPHKTLLLPLSAGVLLARREADLERAFTQDAPYLFHAASGRSWDQGPRSFLCSRRADAVKLWVALLRYGSDGLGLLFDHLCDLTLALHERIVAHPRFEPLHRPDCNILCFRYLPPGITEESRRDELNGRLRAQYNDAGTGWITTTVLAGRRVLRVTMMNPRTTPADLDGMLQELDERGGRLAAG